MLRRTMMVARFGGELNFWRRQQAEKAIEMGAVYEDNFGFWNIDSPEERAFFEYIRDRSVRVKCERCESGSDSCRLALCAPVARWPWNLVRHIQSHHWAMNRLPLAHRESRLV